MVPVATAVTFIAFLRKTEKPRNGHLFSAAVVFRLLLFRLSACEVVRGVLRNMCVFRLLWLRIEGVCCASFGSVCFDSLAMFFCTGFLPFFERKLKLFALIRATGSFGSPADFVYSVDCLPATSENAAFALGQFPIPHTFRFKSPALFREKKSSKTA